MFGAVLGVLAVRVSLGPGAVMSCGRCEGGAHTNNKERVEHKKKNETDDVNKTFLRYAFR